mmetsp:Transcript_29773/g.70781  ORF Transcript_29773/g.70781 Transcript_29773/m.70781 type:complete len:229 (+) Transcript_29773:874-1560(+)
MPWLGIILFASVPSELCCVSFISGESFSFSGPSSTCPSLPSASDATGQSSITLAAGSLIDFSSTICSEVSDVSPQSGITLSIGISSSMGGKKSSSDNLYTKQRSRNACLTRSSLSLGSSSASSRSRSRRSTKSRKKVSSVDSCAQSLIPASSARSGASRTFKSDLGSWDIVCARVLSVGAAASSSRLLRFSAADCRVIVDVRGGRGEPSSARTNSPSTLIDKLSKPLS